MNTRMRGYLLVALQFGLLLPIFLLPRSDHWLAPMWMMQVAYLLQVIGIGVLAAGLVTLGKSLTAHPEPLAKAELKTGGIYALVRHPIYTGILFSAWGQSISSQSVNVGFLCVLLTALLMVKSRFEEALLREKFSGYLDYQRRVGRLIPLVGRIK